MAQFPLRRILLGSLTVYLQPNDSCPDLESWLSLLPETMPVVWLDSARLHPITGRWSILAYDPWLRLTAHDDAIELRTHNDCIRWRGNPLEALRRVLRRYSKTSTDVPAPLHTIGLLGYFSYELNGWIEDGLRRGRFSKDASIPDMMWWAMRQMVVIDHWQKRSWLVSVVDPNLPFAAARRQALEAMTQAQEYLTVCSTQGSESKNHPDAVVESQSTPVAIEPMMTQAEFESMVKQALEFIRAGEIFQANVSQRFSASWSGKAGDLYGALRRINPSPFCCFLSCEDLKVVSCSPERLVRVCERRVSTRPIAGTRSRGLSPEADAIQSLELLISEKERAEHIMLVDLARNDLARVCDVGTVAVDDLMGLEEYSHVIHIVSNVGGRLRQGVDAVDVVRAVFPGGTITGCPKVRCMQILQDLEPVPRGLYTGSLGYLGFTGAMDLNIAIRTMVIPGTQLSFHVGSGIVADSDPTREYQETLAKAGALVEALRREANAREIITDAKSG